MPETWLARAPQRHAYWFTTGDFRMSNSWKSSGHLSRARCRLRRIENRTRAANNNALDSVILARFDFILTKNRDAREAVHVKYQASIINFTLTRFDSNIFELFHRRIFTQLFRITWLSFNIFFTEKQMLVLKCNRYGLKQQNIETCVSFLEFSLRQSMSKRSVFSQERRTLQDC